MKGILKSGKINKRTKCEIIDSLQRYCLYWESMEYYLAKKLYIRLIEAFYIFKERKIKAEFE